MIGGCGRCSNSIGSAYIYTRPFAEKYTLDLCPVVTDRRIAASTLRLVFSPVIRNGTVNLWIPDVIRDLCFFSNIVIGEYRA